MLTSQRIGNKVGLLSEVRSMPEGKIGGVIHVDCSTRVTATLYVCGDVHTHPDHGDDGDRPHAHGHFSQH